MPDEQNIQNTSDFSGIPSLGDAQGLEAFLNNEALAAQGLQVQQQPQPQQPQQPAAQPATNPAQPAANPAPAAQPAPAVPAQNADSITLTREQFSALLAGRAQQPQPQAQANPNAPSTGNGYTAQESAFIQRALAQGYNLDQINNFLKSRNSAPAQAPATNPNAGMEKRIAEVENYLRNQEYRTAETAFINKLTDFGNKWGLSEQDLVTFGNEALKQGINIAMGNVNLETVFRAVYPEQYAIRSRRMTPTNSSQIYGGTSIPESNRAQASKLEDAYVDAFLKGAMPNQYDMLNKK